MTYFFIFPLALRRGSLAVRGDADVPVAAGRCGHRPLRKRILRCVGEGLCPQSTPPAGKIFCPVSFVYRPIFFRQSHQHRPGSIRKNLCVCLIFPGMTNFPLAEKNFLCYAPFIIRKGSCGYDQRNVRLPHAYHFCAGPLRRFLLRGYARHSGHYYSGRQPAAGVRFCIAFLRDPDGAFPSFFAGVLTRPPIAEARGLAHPAGPLYL